MAADIDLVDQVSRLPLYRGLQHEYLAEMAEGLQRVKFENGDALMEQGDVPDGAYFLVAGKARVLAKLPGGGETLIAELSAGSLVGELALIRPERRSATVRASGPVDTLFMERCFFQAALSQLRPSALEVSRNIAGVLAQRLLQRHIQIGKYIEANARKSYFTHVPDTAAPGSPPATFDVRTFLSALPDLCDFNAVGLDRLMASSAVLNVPAGTFLNSGPAKAPCGYIVVRGAVLSCLPLGDRVHQLNVLGPGRFCAIGPMLGAGPGPVRHVARNDSTLLAFSAEQFTEMIGGADQFSLSLLTAVNRHQAKMIQRAGNHFTRLVGLSRLYDQIKDDEMEPVA